MWLAFLQKDPSDDNLDCQAISLWGFPKNRAWDDDLSGINLEGDICNRSGGTRRVWQERRKSHKRLSYWFNKECGKLGPKPNQTIWRTSRRDLRNVTSHEMEIKLVVYWLSLPLLPGSLLGTLTSPSHFRTVAVTDLTGLPLLCREILAAKKEMLNGNAVSWHNARNGHFRYMEIS